MTQTILLLIALSSASLIAIAFYWNNWLIKFFAITVFVVLANTVYFSLDGVKGWPAEEPREVKGILASVVVVNPSSEDKGGIYISLFPKLPKKWYEYEYPRVAPKTYYVEYSNNRAAEFEKAKKAMQEGREVRINGIPPLNSDGSGKDYDGEETSDVSQMIENMIKKFLPKQKDTYRPNIPDVEILAPVIPPAKGAE